MSATTEACAACPTAYTGGLCPDCGTFWTTGENGKPLGLHSSVCEAPAFTPHIVRECLWCHHVWSLPLGHDEGDPYECPDCKRDNYTSVEWHPSPESCLAAGRIVCARGSHD